jgi:hypothetical protein
MYSIAAIIRVFALFDILGAPGPGWYQNGVAGEIMAGQTRPKFRPPEMPEIAS